MPGSVVGLLNHGRESENRIAQRAVPTYRASRRARPEAMGLAMGRRKYGPRCKCIQRHLQISSTVASVRNRIIGRHLKITSPNSSVSHTNGHRSFRFDRPVLPLPPLLWRISNFNGPASTSPDLRSKLQPEACTCLEPLMPPEFAHTPFAHAYPTFPPPSTTAPRL
jgi:hypothetical protein